VASIVSTLPGRCRARDLIEQKPQGAGSPAPIVSAARAAKPSTPARSKAGTSVSAASTRPSACVIVTAPAGHKISTVGTASRSRFSTRWAGPCFMAQQPSPTTCLRFRRSPTMIHRRAGEAAQGSCPARLWGAGLRRRIAPKADISSQKARTHTTRCLRRLTIGVLVGMEEPTRARRRPTIETFEAKFPLKFDKWRERDRCAMRRCRAALETDPCPNVRGYLKSACRDIP
jgi:hypothetical protein